MLPIFLVNPINAQSSESIKNYIVDIQINQDASVNVTENILYDFGPSYRHAAIRDIPLVYTNPEGKKYKIDFEIKSVSEKYQVNQSGENIEIKIGDPDKEITGLHEYQIKYTIKGVITYFDNYDELYWNAIGNGWDVPIHSTSINITSPGAYTGIKCFVGTKGSTSETCDIEKTSSTSAIVNSEEALKPGEGLTFVISYTKNIIEFYEIKPYQEFPWVTVLVVVNILISIVMFFVWFFYGRDPKDNRVLVRMYDAPKDDNGKELSPIEVGTIVDETVNSREKIYCYTRDGRKGHFF